MKLICLGALGIVLLPALTGCSVARTFRPQPDPMEIPGTIPSADELQGRLNAANQITSVNLRDRTLASLAVESADASRLELIREALLGINAVNLRDNTTADCALRLGLRGRADLGVELASLITSTPLRDQTLSRLATTR